jgi:hypothetical protein
MRDGDNYNLTGVINTNTNNKFIKRMYITLTNSKSKRKTIINWEQVHSCYELLDRESRSRVTKINFSKDSYIIVSEKLEDIHKLLNKVSFGLTQEVEWDGEPSFDEVLEDEYNTNRKNYRERDYNRY